MVLAIGLVVDDAIVVVENIYRHIEEGKAPIEAALMGAREIVGPVIAMTITLAAVYAPIGLLSGLTGDAVPRVRLHAGRRRDHLGHHRAHALADDVLGAAHPRDVARLVRTPGRSFLLGRDALVRQAPRLIPRTTGRSTALFAVGILASLVFLYTHIERRAGAERGPGRPLRRRQGAAIRQPRLHRPSTARSSTRSIAPSRRPWRPSSSAAIRASTAASPA